MGVAQKMDVAVILSQPKVGKSASTIMRFGYLLFIQPGNRRFWSID